MKDITLSSIPLQSLVLEACESLRVDILLCLPDIHNHAQRVKEKQKLLQLDELIPQLTEIIKNNSHV